MDSLPLHILLPGGDDELATVHAAALGFYALHEVTRVADADAHRARASRRNGASPRGARTFGRAVSPERPS
jgi:hypothetical protein